VIAITRPAAEQPYGIEVYTVDGLFLKQMAVPKAFSLIPQHAHAHDHLSMLAKGSVQVFRDGACDGEYVAPVGIEIKAGIKHAFLTLEDDTIIYCCHNLHGEQMVKIMAEHGLAEIDYL
jgi:hypothetical protein